MKLLIMWKLSLYKKYEEVKGLGPMSGITSPIIHIPIPNDLQCVWWDVKPCSIHLSTIIHIYTKLHQFLVSSFFLFLHRDTHTDVAKTIPVGMQV